MPTLRRADHLSPEAIGEIIAISLTDPRALGLPFGAWTLDRLVAYLQVERGIGMKRSRLNEVLSALALRLSTHLCIISQSD